MGVSHSKFINIPTMTLVYHGANELLMFTGSYILTLVLVVIAVVVVVVYHLTQQGDHITS